MSVKEQPQSNRFYAVLKKAFEQVQAADPLKGLREKAWDHFLELGLPEKKQEAFQYVPLRQIYEKNFKFVLEHNFTSQEVAPYIYPECRRSHLVFVNGCFRPELSNWSALPKQAVVIPLLEAVRSYGTFLQNRWSKTLKEETDPFCILNLALHTQGVFVYIPPKIVLKEPIQCLYLGETENLLSQPRVQIFAASQSEVSWISSMEATGWMNEVVDIALEDGAQFKHASMTKRESGWLTSALRATLKRSSRFEAWNVLSGGQLSRFSSRISLNGENGEALLQGIWMLNENHQAHTHVVMDHHAPHCHSLQKFKGVMADISQASFEGKILVRQPAQKTEAYQLNNNLILGDHAIAYSKPNLEIFADDVKASHGATVTQIDEEQLFYLNSRGIGSSDAKKLLVQGFCREIIDQIPFTSLREQGGRHVENCLM